MEIHCGLKEIRAWDDHQKTDLPVTVLYPTSVPPTTIHCKPFAVDVATDATPSARDLPLIVISHGNGGTPWALCDLAMHLAKVGFAVALPEHIGNSRGNNALAQTSANLENRPRHISLTIDAVSSDALCSAFVRHTKVGIIGHSIGAYTALAVSGGKPWAGPHETEDGQPRSVTTHVDRRVAALVLLSPATFWFPAGSLRDVGLPIMIRTGSMDRITPASPHADTVIEGVADPSLVEHKSILGAGHHSFLSPFPEDLTSPDFPPSQDPLGFRRAAYQPILFADIEHFFRRNLGAESAPHSSPYGEKSA